MYLCHEGKNVLNGISGVIGRLSSHGAVYDDMRNKPGIRIL